MTRYRFDKVKERGKLKQPVARLVCSLFPKSEKLVPSLHLASVYALLEEFSGAKQIGGYASDEVKNALARCLKMAYAGLSPSTYQSGQLKNCYAHMEKRGSRYLRYALFNAAKCVCR